MRDLRASGVSVIYISHRLGEVEEIADRVVVLRDGSLAGELARDEITHDAMIRLMIGRDLSSIYLPPAVAEPSGGLEMSGLVTRAHPDRSVDLSVRRGEIVGLAVLIHRSVFGGYLFAIGQNEEAARYSGLPTHLVVTCAYAISGLLAGVSAIAFVFYTQSVSPSAHGNFYELYAIAAAVLGGCSLRGGEGSVLGIVLGTVLLQVLQNLVNMLGIPSSLNFAVMGTVILLGVIADREIQRRRQASIGRRMLEARAAT